MAEFSPMMKHYLEIKEQYNDCIVFYRLGDFYEMFFDDAKTASRELEITLTGRDCGQEERAPMCGVPFHAAESYIARLIEKGYKVAICEQLEDPKTAKGIVKRDVIRVVTPGTVIESNMLDEKKNNYIMSIYKKGIYFGIAVCDVTTGTFLSTKIEETNNFAMLLDEISKYNPAEVIVNKMLFNCKEEIDEIKLRFKAYINCYDEDLFKKTSPDFLEPYYFVDDSDNKIKEPEQNELQIPAIVGLLNYLNQTQKIKLEHINIIKMYSTQKYMSLNYSSRRNLELTEKMNNQGKKGTLLWVLDKTYTSMGGRLLRKWINEPLLDSKEINKRLNAVESLGSCTVIASDKTGTLTVNEQTAKKILLPDDSMFNISGSGYNDKGTIKSSKSLDKISLLIESGCINNEATLEKKNNKWIKTGDMIDVAFLALGLKYKMDINNLSKVDFVPYECENKYSAVKYIKNGKTYCSVKGSTEVILSFCDKMIVNGKKLFIGKKNYTVEKTI